MKKQTFAKMMVKAISSILSSGNANSATIVTAIRDTIDTVDAARKGNIANYGDFAAMVNESIDAAIASLPGTYADATIVELSKAVNAVKSEMADLKIGIADIVASKVSYEGTWKLQAKLMFVDSNEDLANATKTSRFEEACKAISAAGLIVPSSKAPRSAWKILMAAADATGDAEKAKLLKNAINAVRGAYEDVEAAKDGKKKIHAVTTTEWVKARKIDGKDVSILNLPKSMRKLHFYVAGGHGVDKGVKEGRFLTCDLLVDTNEKGKVIDVVTC